LDLGGRAAIHHPEGEANVYLAGFYRSNGPRRVDRYNFYGQRAVLFTEGHHQGAQVTTGESIANPNAEQAGATCLQVAGADLHTGHEGENGARVWEKRFPSRSQMTATWRAVEQRGSQLIFKFLDRSREWRLLDTEAHRSPTEIQLLGDDNKMAKMTEIHPLFIASDHLDGQRTRA